MKGRAARSQALREAIQAEIDGAGEFEVRKKADPAKEIVKDFISSFKSDSAEGQSESYAAISEALRELAAFYKSKGPRAALPSSVSRSILDKLQRAEDSLPPEPKTGLFGF